MRTTEVNLNHCLQLFHLTRYVVYICDKVYGDLIGVGTILLFLICADGLSETLLTLDFN